MMKAIFTRLFAIFAVTFVAAVGAETFEEAFKTGTAGSITYAEGEAVPRERMQEECQKVLDRAVREGRQGAVQFCVYIDGECVVDAWAGTYATNSTRKIDGDSLFPIYSTEKQLFVTAAHRAHELGLLDYDAPVKSYWPEFTGTPEKEALTIRQLMGHRAGLPTGTPKEFTVEQCTNWNYMVEWAAKQPAKNPGQISRYLSGTFGWYLGRPLENVYKKPIKDILDEQVLIPASIEKDFFFVSGPEEDKRTVTVYNGDEPWKFERMNDVAYRRAINPAGWAVSSARGIAKFYNRLCGFDGKAPLITPETLREALKTNRWEGEPVTPEINDKWIMVWGMGYGLWGDDKNLQRVFGQGGLGGSEGMCDFENRICIGFTCNISSNYDGFNKITPELFRIIGFKTRFTRSGRPNPSKKSTTLLVGPERELKSMAAARDFIRAERKVGRIAMDERVDVVFDDGVYVQSNVKFDGGAKDNFITFRAANPRKAKLVTGTFITGDKFVSVTDSDVLKELDEAVRDKVLVADLSELYTREFEKLPDVIKGIPEPYLYVNGKEMTLARWPNLSSDPEKCWTSFTNVVDHGWADTNSPNAALRVPHPATFVYEKSDRPNRWNVEKGVWLFGYWKHDWLDLTVRLGSWNRETKEMVHAKEIHEGVGGGTLGRSARRFYAINVFSELDSPGEYYLDREAKLLYLYPTEDLKDAEILLSTEKGPTVSLQAVKGVSIKDFTVTGSAGAAFEVGKCEDCLVENCYFTCLGAGAVYLSGVRNTVRDCEVAYVGQGGISVSGGDEKTLTPAGNVVENCHIHHYANHVRTYRPALQVWGVGNIVRHNEIHDAPHNAMLFGGNDNIIEYNEIYRCVLETADSGAIYTGRKWQTQGNVLRYNYIHDCGPKDGHIMGTVGIYFDDCDCGDAVYGNVFAHMGRAVFIGGGRDHPVENNVFYDCYNCIQMDNRGMEWKQWNTSKPSWNFEEQCEKLNYKNPPWSEKYPRLANIMNDHPREPLYNPMRRNVFIYPKQNEIGCYPGVTNALPRLAPIENNFGLRRKGYVARKDRWRYDFAADVIQEDTPAKPLDLGFADIAKDDFSLREDAPILKLLPGFEPLPFEKMGRLGKDGKAVRQAVTEMLEGDGDAEHAHDKSFL